MNAVNYLELLKLAVPETIVVITALVVLGADLLALREVPLRLRLVIGALISCAGCVAGIAWMVVLPQHANYAEGILVLDPVVQLVKIALLTLTIFTLILSLDTDFTRHVGEYFALILLGAVGTLFLVSSEDILMIFISLELTSLSLYVLTAFNKNSVKSAEAALKYFLFGGMSAAFTLFGLSLLYGISGATNLIQIAATLQGRGLDPLLVLAIVMVVIGFGFKVAAVPFHLWAPDAYEGAPVPSAAFIASASKVAGFFVFAKVMMLGFSGAGGNGDWLAYSRGWIPVIGLVAAASMVLGNLTAIIQTSVRRLIAYSAIAHAGYMLLAIASGQMQSLGSLIYYAITYGLTTVGAFGVVLVVQERVGSDRLADFAGLSQRAPLLSLCMLVFMLSLAGIPPLAGFFAKFYVFAAALESGRPALGLLWLVGLAVATSAVSLYYYLKVLKQVYVAEGPVNAPAVHVPVPRAVALVLLALAVVVLGCMPNLIIGKVAGALALAGL